MIAVVGGVGYEERATGPAAAGLAADIAIAAAAHERRVELAGKVGEDGAGEALLLALAERHVGHAALLRDASRQTPVFVRAPAEGDDTIEVLPGPDERPVLDRGDVELALRYLPDLHVVAVVAGDGIGEGALDAAIEGAAFANARLVVVARAADVTSELEDRARTGQAIVLEAPEHDDGAFALLVGAFAAGLDAMREPGAALRQAVEESGWERVAD